MLSGLYLKTREDPRGICKLSIIVLHAVDRFISRDGTEVTVSVLFSQDHKKCLLLYESIHKKCPILSSQEFARNSNYSYCSVHREYNPADMDMVKTAVTICT